MTDADTERLAKRRRRSEAYFKLWGVQVDLPPAAVPVATTDPTDALTVGGTRGRALANCLMALRGQGITQLEAFGFADAYSVWDHLTFAESQFILTAEPTGDQLIQAAWRYERLWVQLWVLGLVRHLAFPDTEVDSSVAIERAIRECAMVDESALQMRPVDEILDAADVARCAVAVARAGGGVLPGVAFERNEAFRELLDVEQRDVEQRDVEQRDVEQRDVEQRDVEQREVEQREVEQRDA